MVSIKDVAADAGVSFSTVSIVLGQRSDKLKISDAVRKQVFESAQRLGYCRNSLASQFQSGKTRGIAFLSCERSEYVMEIFSGVVNQAQQCGYYCKFYEVQLQPADAVHRQYEELLGTRPAALIIHSATFLREYLLRQAALLRIPVGCVDRIPEESIPVKVLSDSVAGMLNMVNHVVEFGHKRIGFASVALDKWEFARLRFNGYEAGMKSHGLAVNPDWICDGLETIEPFLMKCKEHPESMPTAICCASDYIALNLVMLAQKIQLTIPGDISITGYGALKFCDFMVPKLTSVDQQFSQLGAVVTRHLIECITNKDCASRICEVQTLLKIGESVTSPRQES